MLRNAERSSVTSVPANQRQQHPFFAPAVQGKAPTLQLNQQTEEGRLGNLGPNQFQPHTSIADYPQRLSDALDRTSSLDSAKRVAGWWGYKLWEGARLVSQNHDTDDRPLYWHRLRMRQIIRQYNPSRYTLDEQQRSEVIEQFTLASRGMPINDGRLAWIPDAKRILITGFDPFGFGDAGGVGMSNPSGAAALALDGEIIRNGNIYGQIQAAILPVSFDFFDRGLVEQFFQPYISGNRPVDMVMTISWGGGTQFELEEHAARVRNDQVADNEGVTSGTPANLDPGDPFLQSTLPRRQMRRRALRRSSDPTSREANFTGMLGDERVSGPNTQHTDPSQLDSAISGSGGSFLSNEVFYRTTLLRNDAADENRRTLPVGHLHLPDIGAYARAHNISNRNKARNKIIKKVKRLIIAALPHI